MTPKRTLDPAEFKLAAVKMMTEQNLSVAEVSRRLGVMENCLRDWWKAARERGGAAFPGKGSRSPAEKEIRRLDAEVTRLRAERDPFTRGSDCSEHTVADLMRRIGVQARSPRRIVGWSMDATMTDRFVVDALEMAIERRLPGAGLLAHSDRGSQDASEHDRGVLTRCGMVCSMSGVAQCWDHAPVESFFASRKRELVHTERDTSRDQANARIFEYVEVFDHPVRFHSSLGDVSPEQYERSHNQNRR